MNRVLVLGLGLVIATQASANYVAHEWGTFTSVIGSNGIPQSGMIQEDEVLPSFVYTFGEEDWPSLLKPVSLLKARNCPNFPTKVPCDFLFEQTITQKMETPVVYFYSDRPQSVRFEVGFPDGIISQSFPAPTYTLPLARAGVELKNGYADYQLEILAPDSLAQPPFVEKENIYSHARNTASNLIRSHREIEKFIFYRGIGEFNAKLQVSSTESGLNFKNSSKEKIAEILLVRTKQNGEGSIRSLGSLGSERKIFVTNQTVASMDQTLSREDFLRTARTKLESALTVAGLYQDEATAMIDTWENGYFQTPGLRVLYILSQGEVEEILPATLTPKPLSFERVFVGRLEVLLESEENQLLNSLIELKENFPVKDLGALSLPILNRLKELAEERGLLTSELEKVIDELI